VRFQLRNRWPDGRALPLEAAYRSGPRFPKRKREPEHFSPRRMRKARLRTVRCPSRVTTIHRDSVIAFYSGTN
jgi:hypothetical protein